MKLKLLALAALVTTSVFAAGTVSQSLQPLGLTGNYALTFNWTGDAVNGSVPVTLAQLPNQQGLRVLQVETVPGSPTPTASYNVALPDSFGGDVMSGALVGLSNSTAQFFGANSATPPLLGAFSLKITAQSAAGAQGKVIVYIGPQTIVNATIGQPGPVGPSGPAGTQGTAGGAPTGPYNFTPQAPGGSLTASVGASVTLTPCPLGVSGADSGHYLYVSGGTGTAEAVLLTGGTCTSGATTGTVIFTPANNHSGAWMIASATAGIDEDLRVNSSITILPGTYTINGTITPPMNSTIQGSGRGGVQLGATVLNFTPTNKKMINCANDNLYLKGVSLVQLGTPTAGSYGIYTTNASGGCNTAKIIDVQVQGFYVGIDATATIQTIDINTVQVNNSVSDGLQATNAQGYWNSIISEGNGGNGFTVAGLAPFMTNIQTYNNQGWGLYSTGAISVSGGASFFNNDRLGEIYSQYTAADVGYIADAFIQYAGQSTTNALLSSPGILVDANSGPFLITNTHFFNSNGNSIEVRSNNVVISNTVIAGAGQGAQAGNLYAIKATAAANYLEVQSCTLGGISQIGGSRSRIVDNGIAVNSASPALEILATATQAMVSNNSFINGGAGAALQVDAGATIVDGGNVFIAGSFVNNGARSISLFPNNAFLSLGTSTPTIASAATISPVTATAVISGTATISTITPPPGYNTTQFCAIPTGVWTTTTGGNIALGSTAVVNKALCFTLAADGFWRPSY